MHFTVNASHRDFFQKHHFIELDQVITLEQVDLLKKELDQILSKRLQAIPRSLQQKNALDPSLACFDMWRESDSIKKTSQKFGEVSPCPLENPGAWRTLLNFLQLFWNKI